MNPIVIFGATAVIGALASLWWAFTARPSRARDNLFAGIAVSAVPGAKDTGALQRVGTGTRRFVPRGLVDGLEVRLVQAGHPRGIDVSRLLGIKTLLGVVSAAFFLVLGQPLIALIAAPALFFLPDYWVLSMRDKRQQAIRSAAADMIDQLTICVEAGLGFDAALARVAQSNDGPLADELKHTISDVQAGMPRPQALRALADRVQIVEIRQLVSALLQAQKHGIPLADTLRIQAGEMRTKRKQLVEERAARLNVKMIFPIIFCFMPVFMIVSVAPTVLDMIKRW